MSELHRMLYGPLFGHAEVDAIFFDVSLVQAMLAFELALAKAEVATGVIPAFAVSAIARCTTATDYDFAELAAGAAQAGNLAIPLVQALTARVAAVDANAARYVHWGATSQDVIDTAMVMQLRLAIPMILDAVERAADEAATLAERHITTLMPGRTWLQHATPTTFGLKAAGWMSALDRAHARIDAALNDAMLLQLGGASGTLASLGDRAPEVESSLANELGLRQAELPWHAHRDRFAALASALGIAVGTMGKIARDVALLAQTEIGEAHEGAAEGRGGSSTMPQKRNPVSASVILAASLRAPGLVATMLAAIPHEHERALGGWQAEWETLPELVRVTAGAASHSAEMLGGLEVDVERMRANADITDGVSLAEAVSMALAEHIGKFDAHRTIGAAAKRATVEDRTLAEVLKEMPEVTGHLSPADIDHALTPENYLGSSQRFVRDALARHARDRE